jgi:exopolysaccharide biosynthesis polyprenyl glycosylphosphotransferase
LATFEAGRDATLESRPTSNDASADAARGDFSIARRQGAWRDALLRRMLAVADVAAGLAGCASIAVGGSRSVHTTLWAAVFAPVWVLVAKLLGLYDRDQRSLRHLTVDELPSIFTWSLASTATVALLLVLTPVGWPDAKEMLWLGLVSAGVALLLRGIARTSWRHLTPPEKLVVVGEGAAADAVRRKIELFPDIHVALDASLPQLRMEDLDAPSATLLGADRLLLASATLDDSLVPALVAFCQRHHVKLTIVPPERGFFHAAVELKRVADVPLLEYNTWDVSRSTQLLKRVIDVGVAAVALVVLSPLMLVIAAAVLLDSGRPILFKQLRAGANARPFTMLKFRTMVQDAEHLLVGLVRIAELQEPMFKLRTDPRTTRVGRVLRRTSLDELPQLVNVLRGDMSLVGPRPEQLELVERYKPEHLFRLAVKPGMTGPMQVYGRGELSFDERLAVEREYVASISVGRDVHILALTIASIFHGRGAF